MIITVWRFESYCAGDQSSVELQDLVTGLMPQTLTCGHNTRPFAAILTVTHNIHKKKTAESG